MDSIPSTGGTNDVAVVVDPFLVEALQNPRHRLTILRMELDIQKFLQNPDQQQFEFPHFPTSYLRLAAHRVAQHYGLQTMVQDNVLDGLGITKRSPLRTVEERKEEYDRARARIFTSPSSSEGEESMHQPSLEGKNMCMSGDENEGSKNSMIAVEKTLSVRDGCTSSRVAILRDMEKDRTDPDYDRCYERYVKNVPDNQSFSLVPFNKQKFQPPFVHYDTGFPQLGHMPTTQPSLSYRTPIMGPFCAGGFNQTSRDAVYMQWPTSAMMYAESYEQFRHAVFQIHY